MRRSTKHSASPSQPLLPGRPFVDAARGPFHNVLAPAHWSSLGVLRPRGCRVPPAARGRAARHSLSVHPSVGTSLSRRECRACLCERHVVWLIASQVVESIFWCRIISLVFLSRGASPCVRCGLAVLALLPLHKATGIPALFFPEGAVYAAWSLFSVTAALFHSCLPPSPFLFPAIVSSTSPPLPPCLARLWPPRAAPLAFSRLGL